MCVCVVTNGDELCSLSTRQVGLLDSLNFCQKSACCQVIHCSWGGEDSINTSLRRLDKRTVIIIDLLCFLQQAQDYECLSVALMCWRGSQTLSSCLSAISLTIFFSLMLLQEYRHCVLQTDQSHCYLTSPPGKWSPGIMHIWTSEPLPNQKTEALLLFMCLDDTFETNICDLSNHATLLFFPTCTI